MEGLVDVAKFAVAGTLIGVGAAVAGDLVNVYALNPILRPSAGVKPSPAAMMGRMAFQVVAGSMVAAGVILAGDKLMDMLVPGTDPLYRTFYTLTAFNSMRLTSQNIANVQGLINMAVRSVSPPAAASTVTSGSPGNVSQAQIRSLINTANANPGGCGSGSCGAGTGDN